MCKDASSATLQKEKNICTQWLAKKVIRALPACGRGIWDAHYRSWWAWRQERRLEKGPLDLLQMRLPELQVATGDQGGSDGIVKNIFDSKLGDNAGLIVGYPKFLCHLMASLWRKDICRFDGSVSQEERMMGMRAVFR